MKAVPAWGRFDVHWEHDALPDQVAPAPTISGACFCMRREDFEAVVRIEFPETAAEGILAEHEGTGVDYAVSLWWRRF